MKLSTLPLASAPPKPRRSLFRRVLTGAGIFALAFTTVHTLAVLVIGANFLAWQAFWQPGLRDVTQLGTTIYRHATGTAYTTPLRAAIATMKALTDEARTLNKGLVNALDEVPKHLSPRVTRFSLETIPEKDDYDALMAAGDDTPEEKKLKEELTAAFNALRAEVDSFNGYIARINDHNTI